MGTEWFTKKKLFRGRNTDTQATPVESITLKLTRHAKFREGLNQCCSDDEEKEQSFKLLLFFPVQPPNRVRLAPYQMSDATGQGGASIPGVHQ